MLHGRRAARAKASRTTRSTPNAVFTLTSVAISWAVSLRSRPPLPAYGPSVPSRTATKSISPGRGERAAHPGIEPARTKVHMVIELEAQTQQQTALQDAAGHTRITDGAKQDGVVLAEFI